jgi:hypothetical protein
VEPKGEFREKNLVQHCCKLECLQPLTKRRIDPTRSNNNTTKTLSARPAGGVYPPFCEGLQTTLVCSSAVPNFFPNLEGLLGSVNPIKFINYC